MAIKKGREERGGSRGRREPRSGETLRFQQVPPKIFGALSTRKLGRVMLEKSFVQKALFDNFDRKIRYLPSFCPRNVIVDTPDLLYVNAGIASDTFNVILAKGSLPYPALHQAMADFTAQKVPFALWVFPQHRNAATTEALKQVGLVVRESEQLMAADLEYIEEKFLDTKKLDVHVVCARAEMHHYAIVLSSVFDPADPEIIRFHARIPHPYPQNPAYRLFVAYASNSPVATCTAVASGPFGALYDVCTHPHFRRLGFATHMTSTAVQFLRQNGCTMVGMLASQEGLLVYKTLGFREFGTCYVYGLP